MPCLTWTKWLLLKLIQHHLHDQEVIWRSKQIYGMTVYTEYI